MVWAVLFCTRYFLAGNQLEIAPLALNTWMPLCLYTVIFYLNYLYLIDGFLFKQNKKRRDLYYKRHGPSKDKNSARYWSHKVLW